MRSFEGFYEIEFPKVYRAAFLLSGDRGLAEDATQEAFARALERWRRLRDTSWAGGWVMTTALNVVRRGLRRRREPVRTEVDHYEIPDSDLDLWRAVRALPRRQLESVVLHYLTDLSVAECAALMGCDEGTVKTHLHRARAELSRLLGGERV